MKIALIGYGKMGRMIEQIAKDRGHEIVCVIDVDNQQDFDSEAFKSADVAIEFTNPTAAYGNYLKAFRHNVKVVSGSTGWMKEHGDDVRRMCSAEGGQTLFWASNFSVGVAIFSAVNRYLAKIMNGFPQYDVRMEETHHIHKLDAPSGTALMIADGISEQLDEDPQYVYDRHSYRRKRSKNEIGIHSVRGGTIVGEHEVIFAGHDEVVTISHQAQSKEVFAVGAVNAAVFLKDQKAGMYNMGNLLSEKMN